MNYHVKNTRTFLPYVKTRKKINSREKVPWWTWKQGGGVRGFGCLKYMNVGLKYPQTVVPSFAGCLGTANIRLGCLCLPPLLSKSSSQGHVFFFSYWERGKQPMTAWNPGVTRSWPDIAVPWYYVEHKPFHMTPTTHKTIPPWKIKTKPRDLCIIYEHKNISIVQTTKMTKQPPVLAHMH